MADEKFSFRWGIPWLDGGFTQLPNFMIRRYAEVGVSRSEFLVIIHLAAYHYESANGQASPSLETVTRQMGYRNSSAVRYHIRNLEAKGMLTRQLRAGDTSVYDLGGFSRKVLAAHLEADTLSIDSETPLNLLRDPLSIDSYQRTKENKQTANDDDGLSKELAQRLINLGIHEGQASKWATVRPPEMITGWIEYVQRNGRHLENPAGFLVSKLKANEQPPVVEKPEDDNRRYIEGPYSDLIQH